MQNSLESKPRFALHRAVTGTPVAADTATLADLPIRGAINAGTWLTLDGVVKLTGGAAPTISLVPLMVANYEDTDGSEVTEYVVMGAALGPYSDGDTFQIEAHRGRLYLRISAVTGNPTSAKVLLAGSRLDFGGGGR